METLSTFSGMALFLALCLDFPRQIVQATFDELFQAKSISSHMFELNPNQN
jgi:hypothetical protein